jgi:hypothetical protein
MIVGHKVKKPFEIKTANKPFLRFFNTSGKKTAPKKPKKPFFSLLIGKRAVPVSAFCLFYIGEVLALKS